MIDTKILEDKAKEKGSLTVSPLLQAASSSVDQKAAMQSQSDFNEADGSTDLKAVIDGIEDDILLEEDGSFGII